MFFAPFYQFLFPEGPVLVRQDHSGKFWWSGLVLKDLKWLGPLLHYHFTLLDDVTQVNGRFKTWLELFAAFFFLLPNFSNKYKPLNKVSITLQLKKETTYFWNPFDSFYVCQVSNLSVITLFPPTHSPVIEQKEKNDQIVFA